MGSERLVPDPTALSVIDESDRLKIAGLEQSRSIFDRGGIGMIPIGMPRPEKGLGALSAVLLSHRFRSRVPVAVSERVPGDAIDSIAAASIIRTTGATSGC